jgi:hypothetical protein
MAAAAAIPAIAVAAAAAAAAITVTTIAAAAATVAAVALALRPLARPRLRLAAALLLRLRLPRLVRVLLRPVLAPLRLRLRLRWVPLLRRRLRRLRRRRSSFVNQQPAVSRLRETAPAVSSLRADWLRAGWMTTLSLHLDESAKAGPLMRPGFFVCHLQWRATALKMREPLAQ